MVANAIDYEITDTTVHKKADDLTIMFRIKGEFLEVMELQDYPFDVQDLTVSLQMACRVDGPFPTRFVADERGKTSIQPDSYEFLDTDYQLEEGVDVVAHEKGATSRCFPRLDVSVTIRRRPGYQIYNVVVPTGTIVLMSCVQFLVPLDDMETRLAVTLTLLLTAAAYKLAIITMTPDISYLTTLDRYVLVCALFVAAMVFEGAFLGHVARKEEWRKAAEDIDAALAKVVLGLFGLFHVWFWFRSSRRHESRLSAERRAARAPRLDGSYEQLGPQGRGA